MFPQPLCLQVCFAVISITFRGEIFFTDSTGLAAGAFAGGKGLAADTDVGCLASTHVTISLHE
jgi:hypothetical protein